MTEVDEKMTKKMWKCWLRYLNYTNFMFIICQHVYSDTSHNNTRLSWVSYLFALIPISARTSTLRLTDLRYWAKTKQKTISQTNEKPNYVYIHNFIKDDRVSYYCYVTSALFKLHSHKDYTHALHLDTFPL